MAIKKLTFQLLSDLHLELSTGPFLKIPAKAPFLILAGDITNINHKSFESFFKYCNDNWTKTFYVPGNHEYYSKSDTISEIKSKMKNYFHDNKLNNIVFLDNNTYEIDANTFIIGSTFWTKSPYPIDYKDKYLLNDYNLIHQEKKQLITPQNINDFSKNDCRFINEQTDKLKDKKIIMLTHFPPYRSGTSHTKYSSQPDFIKNYFTWSDDTLLTFNKYNNILCWISGHTHYSYDFMQNNVRLMSNQFGYRNELLSGESLFSDNVYEIDL